MKSLTVPCRRRVHLTLLETLNETIHLNRSSLYVVLDPSCNCQEFVLSSWLVAYLLNISKQIFQVKTVPYIPTILIELINTLVTTFEVAYIQQLSYYLNSKNLMNDVSMTLSLSQEREL